MALIQSFEKTGNFFFKYRGQIPLIVFILGLPFLYFQGKDFYQFLLDGNSGCFKVCILIVSILLSLAGFCVRAYTIGTTPRGTSGRNRDKQVANTLNTKGIYSIVRHPLYLGNYLMWAGLLVFTMNVPLFIIASLIYWIYYERIMFAEERFLESQFGDEYIQWSLKVPAFIPKFSQFQKGDIPFSLRTVLRREYAGVFSMVLCYTIVDYVRWFLIGHLCGVFVGCWCRPSLIVLAFFLVLMLVLRTLKHHSSVLDRVEGRD